MNALHSLLAARLVLGTATAPADGVDEAIAAAQAHAAAGDFDQALSAVREAQRDSDDPALVFVEAQVLRISGACPAAIEQYQRFLERDPPAEDRAVAQAGIEACQDEGEDVPVPAPPASETSEPPADPTAAPTHDAEPEPPLGPTPARDPAGLGLWIGGASVLSIGLAVYGGSWAARGRSTRGDPTLDEYLQRERSARTIAGVGLATASIGASVLVVAVVRHVVRRRRRSLGRVLPSARHVLGTRR